MKHTIRPAQLWARLVLTSMIVALASCRTERSLRDRAPELLDERDELNPNLPRNGELLSIGWINGAGDYVRLACFEYCNDLSDMELCTSGPRTCPAAGW